MGYRSHRIMGLGSLLLVIGLVLLALKFIGLVLHVAFTLAVPLAVIGLVVFLIGWLMRKSRY